MTNPEHPTSLEQHQEPTPDEQRQAALDIFSGLEGVSTDPDERYEQFVNSYAGSWTDQVQMTRDLSGIGAVEDAIDQLRVDAPTGDFIHIDYQALGQLIAERWTIIEWGGTFHAFEK